MDQHLISRRPPSFQAWLTTDSEDAFLGLCERTRRQGLADLDRRYSSCGGLMSAEHLLLLMRAEVSQPLSRLARWIAHRQLVQVAHRDAVLLPAFQFSPGFCGLRVGLTAVVEELTPQLDDLELACWFVSPNVSLAGRSPASVLPLDPEEVRQVARLDRFVLNPP